MLLNIFLAILLEHDHEVLGGDTEIEKEDRKKRKLQSRMKDADKQMKKN